VNAIAFGTPEEVAANPQSYTGQYLQQVLQQHPPAAEKEILDL
jgi:excinuclease ABC subunit A